MDSLSTKYYEQVTGSAAATKALRFFAQLKNKNGVSPFTSPNHQLAVLMEIAEDESLYDRLTSDEYLKSDIFKNVDLLWRLRERYEPYQETALEYINVRIHDYIKTKNKTPFDTCVVKYSAYKTDQYRVAISNLDEIAAVGTYTFTMNCDDDAGKNYVSDIITNPTWLHVADLANTAIILTHNYKYIYLESILKTDDEKIYVFGMGS